MSRRAVTVQLDRRSVVVSGPRIDAALRLLPDVRWMWHEHSRHKAIRVHCDDADDVIAALEADGQRVQIVDRDGHSVVAGGLLGGAT